MLHTHCHPYIFLPLTNSRPHPIPTTCRLPIHSSSSTQSTKFHITVSITQQLHHMHKYNNSKSLFSHNCNGSIITIKNHSNSKAVLQPNNQLQHQSRTCHSPHIQTTTCNRLLLSHLFPHNYVSNMLHDALNRQKHLPLSTSFHASICPPRTPL